MVVQHNMQAANASRTLNITTASQSKSTEKLSSGFKINRAADDAAGLSISEKMRKQIRGLSQASTNASDGVSSVQTAEGALTEVHDMLQRMNELAVQAANGTNSESDRDDIQNEITQLSQEIDRIASTTKFNETFLLKGDIGLKKMYIDAHDAGLEGTLVQNSTRATFTMESLEAGEKYRIGGTQYTIGASTNQEVAEALHLTQYYTAGATPTAAGTWKLTAGDTISIEELEKAAYDFVRFSGTGGEMHERIGVADLIESIVFTPDKLETLGLAKDALPHSWFVGFKVTDAEVWQKIKNGDYSMFSIGGHAVRSEVNE